MPVEQIEAVPKYIMDISYNIPSSVLQWAEEEAWLPRAELPRFILESDFLQVGKY